ncbi:hypothetical protein [Bradyrhizobium sp. SSUT77]|uniref:hypothetical protein n=1 Tax=Bradyrhizobium sp. SSUT77 TaxID=3040603 RepID=UPI00244B202D|nr:hypothetical protein [Bradyrhizobium sp. SSUT77]MDH2341502.1 hypothetical protein [Bradyrhizobium sp. SSUT77]
MIPDGIELLQFRQRRTASGDHYFTTQIGSAFVVMCRDPIERDLWRAIACDPSRAGSRNEAPAPARLTTRRADDGDVDEASFDEGNYGSEAELDDDLPEDLMETLRGKL